MAKKIDRSRIEAGRFELPKKLAFLLDEKVDFLSIADKDGAWTVELPVAALQKLVKTKAQLKALKADHKLATTDSASALDAAETAHTGTRQALAKAEQRIRALEKKLAAAQAAAAAPAPVPAPAAVAPKAAAKGARKAKPQVTYPPAPPAEPQAAATADTPAPAGDAATAAAADAPADTAPDAAANGATNATPDTAPDAVAEPARQPGSEPTSPDRAA